MSGEILTSTVPLTAKRKKWIPKPKLSLETAIWLALFVGCVFWVNHNPGAWIPKAIPNDRRIGSQMIVFSPDGRLVASATFDHRFGVCDVETGKTLSTFKIERPEFLTRMCFSGDNKRLALNSDRFVEVRDVATGRQLTAFDVGDKLDSIDEVRLSRDGNIAFCANSRMVYWWSITDGKPIYLFNHESSTSVLGDVPSGEFMKNFDRRTRQINTAMDTNDLNEFYKNMNDSGSGVIAGVSPDGRLLMTCSRDLRGEHTEIQLWDTSSQKKTQTIKINGTYNVFGYLFSRDGKFLALQHTIDHDADVWDTATGRLIATLEHNGELFLSNEAEFSADGSCFVWRPSFINNRTPALKTLSIWDTRTWKKESIEIGTRKIESLSFDAGRNIVIDSSGNASILDFRTGQTLFSTNNDPNDTSFRNAALSPTMDQFATDDSTSLFIYTRIRSERWWGLPAVPQFWAAVVTAVLLIRSIWRDRRATSAK